MLLLLLTAYSDMLIATCSPIQPIYHTSTIGLSMLINKRKNQSRVNQVVLAFKKERIRKNNKSIPVTEGVAVVPTFDDEISSDSSYCATFQLVWNDMKNEIIKKDIVFNPEEIMATNLNKESFTEDMISDSYYFKAFGPKTIKLKEEIVNGIKEKFNQTSDILDDFDWGGRCLR